MNLPVWLLRKLPMFDYVCPKCNGIVDEKSTVCEHCGEHYDKPTRVPPTVLKDRKCLEDYIRTKLYDKLSSAEKRQIVSLFGNKFGNSTVASNDTVSKSTYVHICPRCKSKVPRKSVRCTTCGELYNRPIRVPSSVLGDSKSLSDYVHTKIFPTLSDKEREYLTRYFTIIFQDGFESGDFSKWDAVYTLNATATVTDSDSHHGNYCAAAYVPQSNGTYVRLWKSFPDIGDAGYARAYVKYSAIPTSGTYGYEGIQMALVLGNNSGWNGVGIGTYWDGGVFKWRARNNTWGNTAFGPPIVADQWYCLEIKDCKTSNCRWWIDGEEQASLPSNNNNSIETLVMGLTQWSDTAVTMYIDCVVVSDTYIGTHEIFSDDFETGDFSKWDGVFGSPSIVTDTAHHGSYAMETSGTYPQCVYKSLSQLDDAYLRFYVNFHTLDLSFRILFGDSLFFYPTYWTWGGYNFNYTASADTWICVEARRKVGNGDGIYQLWIDGELKLNETNATITDPTESLFLGIHYGADNQVYWDCVVVSDAYIGPEGEEGFSITSVSATPPTVIRTGTDAVTLKVEWYDPEDLDASAYTSYFWIRDSNMNTIGPFTASVYKSTVSTYYASYDLDPPDTFSLGKYDVKVLIRK